MANKGQTEQQILDEILGLLSNKEEIAKIADDYIDGKTDERLFRFKIVRFDGDEAFIVPDDEVSGLRRKLVKELDTTIIGITPSGLLKGVK